MVNIIKKYWEIIGGIASGLILTIAVRFEIKEIQLINSIIILILLSVGALKIVKEAIQKERGKHRETLIEKLSDNQQPIRAISLAKEPMKEGEKLGKSIILLWEVIKKMFDKFKVLFDKFKGYTLSLCMLILSVVEMCGGYINEACGGVFTVNGIEILPLVTVGASTIIGIVSNGFTKEQKEKIKALFSKSNTNELVVAEIKKTLKSKEAQLKEFNKLLLTKENELSNLKSELESNKNTYDAKVEMYNMTPQLATKEDVALAQENMNACNTKITSKNVEIEDTKKNIENVTTMINALKSQL